MEKDDKAVFFNNRETELGLEGYPCLIRTAKFSYLKTPIAFAFQKNSPYTKLFSHFLMQNVCWDSSTLKKKIIHNYL